MGSPADDGLGPSLRRLRRAAGLTQEELAERAGISARTVSDIERGLRSVVHGDTARRLSAALGLTGEDGDTFEALARGREVAEPQQAPPAVGLPEVPTPLLGRSRELAAITAILAGRTARLLTLTGPGGTGKTRLAAEAARQTRHCFSGGVYFVSLGDVKDAALAGPELAKAIGVVDAGWSLDAVEGVCGGADEIGDSLEGISALVDQSLVILDRAHPEGRYEMLDVVREYAAKRLAQAGEADETSRRHALHYLALAKEAGPNLTGAGQQDWFRRLDAERANLRRGIAWTIDRGETVLALRYTVALWRYWRQLGEFTEGRRWTESALRMTGHVPASLRARALQAAAALAFPQGDYERLAGLAAEAMDLARRSEDPTDMRNALTIAGFVAVGQGRHADALDAFGQCVSLCRPLGPSWQLATSHLNLGATLLHAGRPADADAEFEECLRLYRNLGDTVFAARTVNQRAQAALALGDTERAGALARDALTEFARQAERQGTAEGLETLAAVAAASADPGRAATLAGAAAAIRETIAAPPLPDLVITSRILQAAQQASGHELWHASWQTGHALTAAEATGYALGRPVRRD